MTAPVSVRAAGNGVSRRIWDAMSEGADRHRRRQPYLPAGARPRGGRPRGGFARGARSRVRRPARPKRLRQEHAALPRRRLPADRGRRDPVIGGEPIAGPGPDRGIVFQHFALFPWKTVIQNVLYGLEKQGLSREECEQPRPRVHRSGRPVRLRGRVIPRSSRAA